MIDLKPGNKDQLIDKIRNIEDQNVIDEIYRLLGIDFDDAVYSTNEAQRNAVAEAREQIKTGQTLSNREANEEIDKWLKK